MIECDHFTNLWSALNLLQSHSSCSKFSVGVRVAEWQVEVLGCLKGTGWPWSVLAMQESDFKRQLGIGVHSGLEVLRAGLQDVYSSVELSQFILQVPRPGVNGFDHDRSQLRLGSNLGVGCQYSRTGWPWVGPRVGRN